MGWGIGREGQVEGDICIHIADTWELNTILPNKQNGKKKGTENGYDLDLM